MDILKAIETIELLNSFFAEVENSCMGLSPFSIIAINKDEFSISFMGHVIWLSTEDERDFNEGKNEYESLKEYLIKESKDIMFVLTGGMNEKW